jgi:hypothetical protein
MKKLALINSYCNDWERLTVLYNNIIKLKELEIDSLIYSPIPLPKEITEIADFVIISKENPILYMPERAMSNWITIKEANIKLVRFSPDYGWASIYQYQKLMEFGSTLDYDHYFPFIYDLIFTPEIIQTFKSSPSKLFFPSPKAKSCKVGNNFMSLSKENIDKLIPLFSKEKYKQICDLDIAEKYTEYLCQEIQGDISPIFSLDEITEHQPNWDLSPSPTDLGIYFQNRNKFIFTFFNILNNNQLQLIINGQTFNLNLTQNYQVFELKVNMMKNNSVIIEYDNNTLDISKYFQQNYKIEHYIDYL